MTITLELPQHLQERAEALAAQRGEHVEVVALDLLIEALEIHAGGLPTRTERQAYALPHLRQLTAERGLDWDHLNEEARERLIDDLLHEI
ncbi:MAG: hypothetical protein M3220_01255 [Chloroflexota bacterium]|nr:hypothetical protein [Chloroflexota bacterium]